ncbi:MAG: sugar phosphate nucleotidyltransferase [Bacteroidales bacterium]|jgi:NDP-sugar pyrophosphorylase family protein|nr:sugar phosphate nucleotidyltransferase [Bacteroidales bacterium]
MSTKQTAMILAAGKGTRLSELTKNQPKALVKINGISLLERVIHQLENKGFQHFVVNVHHFADQIIDHLKQTQYQHLKIDISDERETLLETGGGILNARSYFAESEIVLVHNVDILTNLDLKSITDQFEKSGDAAWLVTQDRPSTRKLLFDKNKQLIGWQHLEKSAFKWVHHPQTNYTELAFSGIHLFRPALFHKYQTKYCSIIDLYLEQAKTKDVKSIVIKPDYWFDIGKFAEFQAIEDYFKQIETN